MGGGGGGGAGASLGEGEEGVERRHGPAPRRAAVTAPAAAGSAGEGGGLRARSIEPAGSLEEASVGERSTPNAK